MIKFFSNRVNALRARGSIFAGIMLLLAAPAAHATTFADLATGLNTQMGVFGNLLVTGAFLAGLGAVCWGIWTFRVAHKSEGRDAKFSHGMVQVMVGAALLALPAITGVSVASLFEGGTSTAATQQTINVGN
jgi:hypothetical protein